MRKIEFITCHGTSDFSNLDPREFTMMAIADSLAKINRYNGRTEKPWSVAIHSVLVSELCSTEKSSAAGLLHDAHETFIGDIVTPAVEFIAAQSSPIGANIIKQCISEAKSSLDRQIEQFWGIDFMPSKTEVAKWDRIALLAEMQLFFNAKVAAADLDYVGRALDILNELPQDGDWKTAKNLWIDEALKLSQCGALRLPLTEFSTTAFAV